MSLTFAVVYEAEADFRIATELADRVLVDVIDWLDESQVGYFRTWFETSTSGACLSWTDIKTLAREANIRVHGHFDGQPGEPDAAAARRAILYLLREFPDLDAVVLIRDQDDQPARRQGLEQARTLFANQPPIVIGLAIVERECWVLSGFEPLDDEESTCLAELSAEIGFDPRSRNHQLTACKKDQAKKSAKRVLNALIAGNPEREQRCWRETHLDTLRSRGEENGLTAFLNEVREKLASLIGHPS
jgi:hypothetical protein